MMMVMIMMIYKRSVRDCLRASERKEGGRKEGGKEMGVKRFVIILHGFYF